MRFRVRAESPLSGGFRVWCRQQRHREDAVGDFCSDWSVDWRAPRVRKAEDVFSYLHRVWESFGGAVPERVLRAARRAWAEYEEAQRAQRPSS